MKNISSNRNWKKLAIFSLCVFQSAALSANDSEREELYRVLEEIRYVEKSLIVARNRANEGEQMTFNYDALSQDLTIISEGISDYLEKARRAPRLIRELQGEYHHAR